MSPDSFVSEQRFLLAPALIRGSSDLSASYQGGENDFFFFFLPPYISKIITSLSHLSLLSLQQY